MGDAARDAFEAETGLDGDELYPKPRKLTVCPRCGKKFKKSIGLKDHMRNIHGIET